MNLRRVRVNLLRPFQKTKVVFDYKRISERESTNFKSVLLFTDDNKVGNASIYVEDVSFQNSKVDICDIY